MLMTQIHFLRGVVPPFQYPVFATHTVTIFAPQVYNMYKGNLVARAPRSGHHTNIEYLVYRYL